MSLKLGLLASSQQQASPLLLDVYPGATAAFSLRKLRTAYTGFCIRVRRSSDNTQLDIGFNGSGSVDTTALLTFVGANNGFVTIWYDQSGSANNSGTGGFITQPQIVFSGSLLIKNSRPYITASTAQQFVLTSVITRNATDNYSWWYTYEKDTSGNHPIFSTGAGQYFWLDYGVAQYINNAAQAIVISPVLPINTGILVNNICFSSAVTMYTNASSRGSVSPISGSSSWTEICLNAIRSAKITMAELVYYPTNESANRIAISNNINTYYTIY